MRQSCCRLSHEHWAERVSLWQRSVLTLAALAAASAFAGLGFWQSGRAEQKERWLEAYTQALVAQPVDLARTSAAPLGDLPLRVSGTIVWRKSPLIYLDNQQREGQVGVRAYAVADVIDGAAPLLVELGWLPLRGDRNMPALIAPHGSLHLDGLLMPWPAQGLRLADNRWDTDAPFQLLTYMDRGEISEEGGLSLYDGVLQPDPRVELAAKRDVVALPNTLPPEHHRGYAVQWWGLSLTVLVVYLVLALRRRKK